MKAYDVHSGRLCLSSVTGHLGLCVRLLDQRLAASPWRGRGWWLPPVVGLGPVVNKASGSRKDGRMPLARALLSVSHSHELSGTR